MTGDRGNGSRNTGDGFSWVHAGLLISLLGLAGCGAGYREGAAAGMTAGTAAHGEAIVAIAGKMHKVGCVVGGSNDDRCDVLGKELTQELARCLDATGCDDALAEALDGEPEEVAGFVAMGSLAAAMKSAVTPRR